MITCDHCRYWDGDRSGITDGICRRSAPLSRDQMWPRTHYNDGCYDGQEFLFLPNPPHAEVAKNDVITRDEFRNEIARAILLLMYSLEPMWYDRDTDNDSVRVGIELSGSQCPLSIYVSHGSDEDEVKIEEDVYESVRFTGTDLANRIIRRLSECPK